MTGKQIQPWAAPRYTNTHFAEEERRCWELRLRNYSLRRIAAETGLSRSTVERRLRSAMDAYREDTAELRDQYIQLELERLDAAQARVLEILEANHMLVQDGRVITVDGRPIPDAGPVLAAAREYRAISESRRKLLGLDAPAKASVTHVTVSEVDAAIAELADAMDVQARAEESVE